MNEEDDKIIEEAIKRFQQCEDWEKEARSRFVDDLKFAEGDSFNNWQWPDGIYKHREMDTRPTLTINKTRQHNLQIINDAKQNKPGIKIDAVGNDATFEAAQIFEGCTRHIEAISKAQDAYDTAVEFQVKGGIGYWRVVTDYVNDDSFDQEIFIRRVIDPLSVYIDPDIKELDGSDARYGFVFDNMPLDKYKAAYPKADDTKGSALGELPDGTGWITENHVRVAEYYRKVTTKDRLIYMPKTGETTLASKLDPKLLKPLLKDKEVKTRTVKRDVVEWYLIAGNKIIDRTIWPGKYVPIIRCVGEEVVIDGTLDRKGHTRAMRDPQRMYNYWTSTATEQVALQTKSPYVAPVQAIEGFEDYWKNANKANYAILPYKHVDDNGKEIPRPEREQPPVMATAYMDGMKIASEEMRMASGQYQETFGQQSNAESGKAINARQRQGDIATYHFIDNQASAIRFTGEILIDLIPKVYDTPRIVRILGEDGEQQSVSLDPQAQKAYVEKKNQKGDVVKAIFNPNVGRYSVIADIGPGYATKRMEAFNAYSQIISQNQELVRVIGDLMFKNADFPGSDEIAERLRRLVPPQATGDGPPPELAEAQQAVQHLQGLLKNALDELAESKRQSKDETGRLVVDGYRAVTDRIKVEQSATVTPKDSAGMLHDLMKEEHAASLVQTVEPQPSMQ